MRRRALLGMGLAGVAMAAGGGRRIEPRRPDFLGVHIYRRPGVMGQQE